MTEISKQPSPVFEFRTPGVMKPQEALIRWQQQYFPELSIDDFTILSNDGMEIFRHPHQDVLLPEAKYLVIFRSLWQEVVKFMSYSKKDRYSGKYQFNMEEILLNNKLQFYARNCNEQGDSRLFDLFMRFLTTASSSGVNPFRREKKKKEGQYQMIKISLQILAIFLSEASSSDILEIRQRVHEMHEEPVHFRPKGGLCMIGGLLILLGEGVILGIFQIFQFFS